MLATAQPPSRGQVVVADDDPAIRELVAAALARAGYDVIEAPTGAEALGILRSRGADLLVLDIMLPDVHGLDLLAELRDEYPVPTIVLSGRGTEADRVLGLQCGADDYVVKPFSPRELVARAEAVLRRSQTRVQERTLRFGDVELDLAAREMVVRGQLVEATAKEFKLLEFLAAHPRAAFSRRDLLREVWHSAPEFQTETTVTEHVRRLRRKIEPDPQRPRHLLTVHGVGYRLEP